MHLHDESARAILGPLDGEPHTPSGVDIRRAISEGRRRRRVRRVGGYAATGVVTVLVLVGAAAVADAWQRPQTSPAGSVAFGSPTVAGLPAPTASTTAGSGAQAMATPQPQAPKTCKISTLPLPDGRRMALVTGADPTGRFLLGRTYPSPRGGGDYHVVVWDRREPTAVPMDGADQALRDVTTNGVAVGASYGDTVPMAWLYRHGKLSRLPGGDGAEANAINEANVAVGVRKGRPIIWPSVDRAPVELPLPAGAAGGEARDIDEDGTVVGYVWTAGRVESPYVWLPDHTGQNLRLPDPSPVAGSSGSPAIRAYTIRDGWVTGIIDAAPVRWDLRTGEPRLFPEFDIRASTANRFGWQVGTDRQGRGRFLSDAGPVVLPDLASHKAGELRNIPQTLSDDGTVIGGQSDDNAGVIHAVVWECA